MIMSQTINFSNKELYNHINDELKSLYVAITRAKNTFVVYDQGNQAKNRKNLDNVWKSLNVADFITATDIKKIYSEGQLAVTDKEMIQQYFYKGFEFLRREQFTHALKCFEYLKHELAINLTNSFILLNQIQNKENYILMTPNVDKDKLGQEILKDYLKLGDMFLKNNKVKDAALCYFIGQDYKRATEYFEKAGMKKHLAHIKYMLGDYAEAQKLFFEMKNTYLGLICKELCDDIDDLMDKMYELFNEDQEFVKNESYIEIFERYTLKYFQKINKELNDEKMDIIEKFEMKKSESKEEIQEDSFVDVKSKADQTISGGESFNIISDKLTDENSFKILKEFEQKKDTHTDSFLNLTFDEKDGKPQSVGQSAFLEIGKIDEINFMEEKIISKILKFGSCFLTQLKRSTKNFKFSTKRLEKPTEKLLEFSDKAIETDFNEFDPKLVAQLIKYFMKWNLDELHFIFLNKFKNKENYRKMVFKLAEDYSIIGSQKMGFSYDKLYSPSYCFSASDKKRIVTLAF